MLNVKNLIQNTVLSLCIISASVAVAQNTDYVTQNLTSKGVISGSNSNYSRGLFVTDSLILVGNADGSFYTTSQKQRLSKIQFKKEGYTEIRDIAQTEFGYILMHSGDDGKLTYLDFDLNPSFYDSDQFNGIFFDAMDFKNGTGILVGDPVDGKFSIFYTVDSGRNWNEIHTPIQAENGEFCFAASGTNVELWNDSTIVLITGGQVNHFYKTTDFGHSWNKVLLPFFPSESSGAFSMCFADQNVGVIVGGDYKLPELRNNTAYFTEDGGKTWFNSQTFPRGYRSCVFYKNGVYYCCGRNGIDYSLDGGKNWHPFANGTFYKLDATESNLVATAKHGEIFFFNLVK